MVIRTRKSLHTYWFIKDAKVAQFRPIQKALVSHFGGDPACVNESRVMRLPGFYHCKKEPVLVECVLFHPERRYTQEQIAEIFIVHLHELCIDASDTVIGLTTGVYHEKDAMIFLVMFPKNDRRQCS